MFNNYIFKVNQPVLLDEHYYLNRNQKLAPKYTGPHIITKLKGDCNVELLLDNGKFNIVHVNRLKPYIIARKCEGQNFHRRERNKGTIYSTQRTKTSLTNKIDSSTRKHP